MLAIDGVLTKELEIDVPVFTPEFVAIELTLKPLSNAKTCSEDEIIKDKINNIDSILVNIGLNNSSFNFM